MNSINKQTSSFDLSRFNKSGNTLSPITNNGSSLALSSKRLIQSRQTSTPLTKTMPWQRNSISPANQMRTPAYQNSVINRSPRYSLSSVNATPKSATNIESLSTPTIQTVTGPLLASTRFNVNLGTYSDTKSPGLSSRVVQYHNELSGRQTSTHQVKYGSPGQFPIVQLYKKELPILTRSPRRCTVRIAPPDPISYNSDQANTILRDSFSQNPVESTGARGDTEINTRSVLEALKEISRKRIHTNDDIDDISKRQRKGSVSSPSASLDNLNKDGKRMREDTPPKPKEPTSANINSASKRICVVNEIESSLSSSRLMRLQQGQKRKASLNSTENFNKQRRVSNGQLVSRQTQTHISNGITSASCSTSTNELLVDKQTDRKSTAAQTEEETTEKCSDIQMIMQNSRRKHNTNEEKSIRDIDEVNSTLQFARTVPHPPKPIFREEPLEIVRQNKLEVMLSALSGKEPELIPLPDMTLSALKKKTEANTDAVDFGSKEVVSILSPKNKVKHDKHVTFAIPNSEENSSIVSEDASKTTDTAIKPAASLPSVNFSATPLSSTSASNNTAAPSSNSNSLPFTSTNACPSFPAPLSFGATSQSLPVSSPSLFASSATSTAFGITPAVTSTIVSSNILALGSPTSAKPSQSPKSNPPAFGANTTTTVANNIVSSTTVQNADKPVQPAINFTAGQSGLNFGSPAFGTGGSLNPPAFGGLVPSATAAGSVTGKPDTTATLATPTAAITISGGFQLTSPNVSTPTTGANMFGPITTSAAAPILPFSAPSSLALGSSSTQPALAFGGTKLPAFNSTAGSTVTTSSNPTISFGTPTSQSSLFPTTTAASFGTTPNTSATATSAGMFSFNAKLEAAPVTTVASNFSFGSSTPNGPSASKPGGFKFDLGKPATGLNTTAAKIEPAKPAMFGGDSNLNKPGSFTFGSNTTTAASTFGATTASKSTASLVTPNTTASTVFGGSAATSSTFGPSNKTVVTGFDTPTTTASTDGFGTASNPANVGAFGTSNTASPHLFGATSSAPPAFGVNKPAESGFGVFVPSTSTLNPGFGNFNTPTTTQASSTFGFAAPSVTQGNTFGGTPGSTTNSTFTFGTNTATKPFAFGNPATTTTTASTMFGATTPAANSSSAFGSNNNSAFGNPTGTSQAFGSAPTTTTAASFGQPNTAGVFGTASSGFGTGTSGSVFGVASNSNTNNNTFGSAIAPSAFGAPAPQSSAFGAAGPANQAAIFGSTSANQSNTFGGASANQSSTFGSASQPQSFGGGFGSSASNQQASGFGAFGTPTAQPAPQPSGVFAFGVQAAPAAAPAAAAGASSSGAFQFGGTASTAAKPSGFNFSANTSSPNLNFGAAAFGGSVAPGQFNTQTPSAGMFNIGSGSTAPKQRPMIKARRRT